MNQVTRRVELYRWLEARFGQYLGADDTLLVNTPLLEAAKELEALMDAEVAKALERADA